jgi:quinol monooxygenase YgiN
MSRSFEFYRTRETTKRSSPFSRGKWQINGIPLEAWKLRRPSSICAVGFQSSYCSKHANVFLLLHSNFEFIFIVQSERTPSRRGEKRTEKEASEAGNLFSACVVNVTQDEIVEKYRDLAHYGFHLEKSRRKKYWRQRKISLSHSNTHKNTPTKQRVLLK